MSVELFEGSQNTLLEVNGPISVTAASETGAACAIGLDAGEGNGAIMQFRANGKTTLTAKTGLDAGESYGIYMDSTQDEGGTIGQTLVELNGETSITANDATFTGSVSHYFGTYIQTAGTVVLDNKDGYFFGAGDDWKDHGNDVDPVFELRGGTFTVDTLDLDRDRTRVTIGGQNTQAELIVNKALTYHGATDVATPAGSLTVLNNGVLSTNDAAVKGTATDFTSASGMTIDNVRVGQREARPDHRHRRRAELWRR